MSKSRHLSTGLLHGYNSCFCTSTILWCLNLLLAIIYEPKCFISCFMGNKLRPRPVFSIDNASLAGDKNFWTTKKRTTKKKKKKMADAKDAKVMEEEHQTDRSEIYVRLLIAEREKNSKGWELVQKPRRIYVNLTLVLKATFMKTQCSWACPKSPEWAHTVGDSILDVLTMYTVRIFQSFVSRLVFAGLKSG